MTAVLLACAASAGCARRTAPDVILVVLDTLRADHVSCYGYGQPTTPHLDALAQGATRYDACRSTAPWTVPSHASLFTGLLPFEHGADAFKQEPSAAAPGQRATIVDTRPLSDAHWTLAEALRSAGYRTAGFVANTVYLSDKFGFAQGFETYQPASAAGVDVVQRGLDWLQAAPDERPSFLFLNLLDCHRPYNVGPLPEGRAAQLPALPAEAPGELLTQLVQRVLGAGSTDSAELAAKVRAQYDHGVAHADLAVGKLVEALRKSGRFERALLIVTSDHGEYFGEHRLVEHSKDIYEPALRVPLIVKEPGQSAARVDRAPITIAAVPRMVIEHLPQELRRTTRSFPTQSAPWAEIRYSRPHDLSQWGTRFHRERVAVYADRFKLILTLQGGVELYDLKTDPGELTDLSSQLPDLAGMLERKARAALATKPAPSPEAGGPRVELTPQERAELERLGYLGK